MSKKLIKSFSDKKNNWDGHKGTEASERSIKNALFFYKKIKELKPERIMLVGNGEIRFLWNDSLVILVEDNFSYEINKEKVFLQTEVDINNKTIKQFKKEMKNDSN